MKANDLLVMTSVALGTGALTVLTLWPGTLDAGNDATLPAQIPKPKLISNGTEMTLTTADGQIPKAGENPVFELTAISRTNTFSHIFARVTMSASSPADRLSRAIRMPTVLWTDTREFIVSPGETKKLTFASWTNLPPNKFISVSLQDVPVVQTPPLGAPSVSGLLGSLAQVPGNRVGITALNFSTVVPASPESLLTSR